MNVTYALEMVIGSFKQMNARVLQCPLYGVLNSQNMSNVHFNYSNVCLERSWEHFLSSIQQLALLCAMNLSK